MGTTEVKCKTNKPNQPVKGPGKTGKKEPIIPNKAKRNPMKSKKMSIIFYILDENTKPLLHKFITKKLV